MTENKNMPAFACVGYGTEGNGYSQEGLTKREYFAGLAMQGLLANPFYAEHLKSNIYKPAHGSIGEFAVEMADELLKELDT